MHGVGFSGYTNCPFNRIRIWVSDTMWAYALHDTTVRAPVRREVPHVVLTGAVHDTAMLAALRALLVDIQESLPSTGHVKVARAGGLNVLELMPAIRTDIVVIVEMAGDGDLRAAKERPQAFQIQ